LYGIVPKLLTWIIIYEVDLDLPCGVCVWCVAPGTHTTGPNFTLPNTDYAHKTSQVISVKHV